MKRIKSPEGVLVNIRTKLCKALELDSSKLKLLVDKFVRENMQVFGSKTHYVRVNTYNEFTGEKMTIKGFFKFLRIINIQSVTITVKVKTNFGREVEVSDEQMLANPDSPSNSQNTQP